MTRGEIFKKLPAVYTAWFDVKLAPILRGSSGQKRTWRESKTLVELIDTMLGGDLLQALMIALGRLNAVTDVATNEGTPWSVAAHHEIVSSDAVSPITPRARANQAAEQRQMLRTQGYIRGTGMPGAA